MSNRMSLPIRFCKPFVRERSITCRHVGHRLATGHRPQATGHRMAHGALRMASAQTNWPHGFTGRTSKVDVPSGPSFETQDWAEFRNKSIVHESGLDRGCACAGACACGIVPYHARVLLVSMWYVFCHASLTMTSGPDGYYDMDRHDTVMVVMGGGIRVAGPRWPDGTW